MAKDLAQFFPEKTSFALPGGIGYFNGDFSIQGIIPNQSYFNKFVPKKEQDRLSQ
jgi:hypothetical protein